MAKTKKELLAEAAEKGLVIDDDTLTNPEIQQLINEAPDKPSDTVVDEGTGTPEGDADAEDAAEGDADAPEGSEADHAGTPGEDTPEGEGPDETLPDLENEPSEPDVGDPDGEPEGMTEQEVAVLASEVIEAVLELPQPVLARVARALDEAKAADGIPDPSATGPTIHEQAQILPVDDEAKADFSPEDIADAVDIPVDEVADYSIRQASIAGGRRTGPRFVIALDTNGIKHSALLAD